jgi:hypothetical protein
MRNLSRPLYAVDPETGRRFPIPAGGSGDQPPADPPADDPQDPPADPPADGPDPEQLPDDHPVVRTMRNERESRKAAERRAQQLEQQLAQIRQQNETDTERAIREAREQAADEVRQQYATERLTDRIRVAAARKLNDPEDAVRLLDLSDLNPESDSLASEIETRLGSLLESKPYLAVTSETPSGSGDAGSRTPPARPEQLTRSDLARMSPEEIAKARHDGRLDDAMQGRA